LSGELHELKEELDNPKEDKKKEGVKKVIAAMTVGKDVSILFPDVVKCMNTQNLELKKLVYLYIMNYAKSNPDLAILAVNTFVQDAQHPNPLIRALAVRTMGCIRVNRITEYLCEPLRKCLKDGDPYVRKTAAVCVAKLHDINPELVQEQGFLDMLRDLLSDSNPMVVANAVAALSEIDENASTEVFKINAHNLNKLLAALNECTEWGQVFILNSLASYMPKDSREAENICERVTPRLQHANSAVVLGAVKVLMKYMDAIQSQEVVKGLCKKMAPPLVTLISKEPEIQYVALRNINLIIQKRPAILQYEMKVFFCKYNDPIYVKMEKLEIMMMLVSERNVEQVLLEFKEYATEVDVEFVRKAVRAIGRCAIKLEKAAERCIHVLLELIQTKVNYVVQEAIIVIKDIFRRYPNRYESIIATLCENLDTLDEPEAKASMIWIIGEYAERIDNADELLSAFLDNFKDENAQVQLQLLTSSVKLFLKKPKTAQALVQKALDLATQETDNPDLRDRGYVYWRLLSTDPEAAKAVVLGEKPLISDDTTQLEPTLLDELITNLSTLSSVYHKPPETFIQKPKLRIKQAKKPQAAAPQQQLVGQFPQMAAAPPQQQQQQQVVDLLGMGSMQMAPPPVQPVGMPGMMAPPVTAAQPQISRTLLLAADKGKGLQISGGFARREASIWLDLVFANMTAEPMNGFAVQFNRNTFGLAPAAPLNLPMLPPGQSIHYPLPVATNGPLSQGTVTTVVQMAVKNNIDILYFAPEVPLHVLFTEAGRLEKQQYLQMWRAIPDANERTRDVQLAIPLTVELLQPKLEVHNLFFIARRRVNEQDVVYLSARLTNDVVILVEMTLVPGAPVVKICSKTDNVELIPLFETAVEALLRQ